MAKSEKFLSPPDLAAFFESTTMLLRAGVPANECPEIVAGDMEGSVLAARCRKVAGILNGGEVFALSEALGQSGAFPPYAVEMTGLGEESGRLEGTTRSLGEYYRRQEALAASIRSAISGPVLLMVMMSVVLIFLISFVLPVFENVFRQLVPAGGGLGGAFLAARVAMAAVGMLLVLILALLLAYALPGGPARLGRLAQRLPFTRGIHYALNASRFTGGLAMLLASGLPTGEAVEKAGVLVDNRRIAEKVSVARADVDMGEDLGQTLVRHGVLEGFEAKILLSASRAGQTEVAMNNLSAVYAETATAGIDRLLGLIEPALVGVLSTAIGVILLSVMLPLTGILSSLG
jgi:type IV pilus assembly protein PilC